MNRSIGYYEVCHPYFMDKKVIGHWDGVKWTIPNIGGPFDDDELNWIKEKRIKRNEALRKKKNN